MFIKFGGASVIFLFIGFASGQISNQLDDIEKELKKRPEFNEIEQKLAESGIDFSNLNSTKFNPEKLEKAFREKCEKQDAADAVDILKDQQDVIKDCVTQRLNGSEIHAELEEAKKTGSMDEVFAKYCNKWPGVSACFENVTATARRCLEIKENKGFNRTLDIVQELQEFMCHKDGDRLAMFVAEGGVECIDQQQEGIKQCFNTTFGNRLPEDSDEFSATSLASFLLVGDNCEDMENIRTCVNQELEKCKDSTPANIVDASFKFVKKQMACNKQPAADQATAAAVTAKGSAYSIKSSLFVHVQTVLLSLLLFKYF